jgi:hypothetical protein
MPIKRGLRRVASRAAASGIVNGLATRVANVAYTPCSLTGVGRRVNLDNYISFFFIAAYHNGLRTDGCSITPRSLFAACFYNSLSHLVFAISIPHSIITEAFHEYVSGSLACAADTIHSR